MRPSARRWAARWAGLIGGAIGAVGGAVVDNLLINALTARKPTRRSSTRSTSPVDRGHAGPQAVGPHAARRQRDLVHAVQHLRTKREDRLVIGQGVRRLARPRSRITRCPSRWRSARAATTCSSAASGPTATRSTSASRLRVLQRLREPAARQPSWRSVEGTGNVPAYRGICYIVFHNMTLDNFGNRMPQITAEIVRAPPIADPDDLAEPAARRGAAAGGRRVRARHHGRQVVGRVRQLVPGEPATPRTARRIPWSRSVSSRRRCRTAGGIAGRDLVRHRSPGRRLPDRAQGRDADEE